MFDTAFPAAVPDFFAWKSGWARLGSGNSRGWVTFSDHIPVQRARVAAREDF